MEEKDKNCKHCKCNSDSNDSSNRICDYDESDDTCVANAFIDAAINALDMENFDAGVADYSRLCGKIAALCMVGVEPSQALAYISECEDREITFDNNMKVAEMQTNAQVAVAKYGMTTTLS